MVPTVRHVLLALPSHAAGGLVFSGAGGGILPRSPWSRAWDDAIDQAKVRRIRPYDLRHTYASLLIAAGKNPLYIARQMGHYSAGFTLDTYGHLTESVPRRPVEWIDDLVFPEGVGLNLDLCTAPQSAVSRSEPQEADTLERSPDTGFRSSLQPDAAREMVEAAGIEPASWSCEGKASTRVACALNSRIGPPADRIPDSLAL